MSEVPGRESFRRLMAQWPTGVAVVTAREGERDYGLTVNALLSISLEPPMLLVSLDRHADSTPIVARTRGFAVSFLSSSQRALSDRFARAAPSEEKFEGVPVRRTGSGRRVLDGAVASLDCRLVQDVEAADHRLFVGEVIELSMGPETRPLVFHRSGYTEVSGERL